MVIEILFLISSKANGTINVVITGACLFLGAAFGARCTRFEFSCSLIAYSFVWAEYYLTFNPKNKYDGGFCRAW